MLCMMRVQIIVVRVQSTGVSFFQMAIDLLEDMSEAGLVMDPFTYAHAIEACCNGGNRVREHTRTPQGFPHATRC